MSGTKPSTSYHGGWFRKQAVPQHTANATEVQVLGSGATGVSRFGACRSYDTSVTQKGSGNQRSGSHCTTLQWTTPRPARGPCQDAQHRTAVSCVCVATVDLPQTKTKTKNLGEAEEMICGFRDASATVQAVGACLDGRSDQPIIGSELHPTGRFC